MLLRCLFILLLFSNATLLGQLYSNGQNPSSVKWRKISSENFEVIFPSDFEDKAKDLADIVAYANIYSRANLYTKPKKISIILQNNTTVDNGFVTLAPWRSEFYATPSQENEGVDWLKKLAVHEYRHVVQIEKFNEGVGRVLYFLMGEQGLGALFVATTPLWFVEGDAVSIETRKTNVGRGDYGPFIREFKAQIMEADSFSYEKASFGSYKEYVTDHYKFGYYMVDYVKAEYGEHVWDSVLYCINRNPIVPYPFSYHLKRITGKTTPEIYGEVYRYYKEKWKGINFTKSKLVSPVHSDFASYYNPLNINGKVYAFKYSYDKPITLCSVNGSSSQKIHVPGRIDLNSFNHYKEELIWAEKRSDPRWQYRDYSELIIYNVKTKKRNRVKKRSRWFAPTFSPDGKYICAVEVGKNNAISLVVVNRAGEVLHRLVEDADMLYHPSWNKKGIHFVALKNNLSTIKLWSPLEGIEEEVFSTTSPILYPKAFKEGVVFQVSLGKKDKLVIYDSDSVFEVVDPEFGLQNFSFDGDSLLFSDYHSTGFRLKKARVRKGKQVLLSKSRKEEIDVKKNDWEIEKYYPLRHLINIHSWAPFSFYPSSQDAELGLTLFSQNKLSSSVATANFDYNPWDKTQTFKTGYEFSHFYPVLYAQYKNSWNPNTQVLGVNTSLRVEEFAAGSKLRLYYDGSNFNKSIYIEGAYINSEIEYDFESTYKDTLYKSENTQWVLQFSSAHKRAKRDLFSPWSFTGMMRFYSDLNRDVKTGMFSATITTPGIMKNQGLKIRYQQQLSTDLFSVDYISLPRGSLSYNYKDASKISIDYAFPIWYPDLKLGKIVYFQRIKGGVFYDNMSFNDGDKNRFIEAFGLDVSVDFNPFRYSYLTEVGLEVAHIPGEGVFYSPTFRVTY